MIKIISALYIPIIVTMVFGILLGFYEIMFFLSFGFSIVLLDYLSYEFSQKVKDDKKLLSLTFVLVYVSIFLHVINIFNIGKIPHYDIYNILLSMFVSIFITVVCYIVFFKKHPVYNARKTY